MKATVRIDMDNDAFHGDNAGNEVARILRTAAQKAEYLGKTDLRGESFNLRDLNGNIVGAITFTKA